MSPEAESLVEPGAAAAEEGTLVVVVGPSGAGKDSVIGYARARLANEPRLRFVRRVVTRPCDPAAEDHDTLLPEEFARAEARGAFALAWQSHGLSYGIPVSLDQTIASGSVAVLNGSRAALPATRARYANVLPVLITAAPEILEARLGARGREAGENVRDRLSRNAGFDAAAFDGEIIDNGGPLENAGEAFLRLVRACLAR